MRKHAKDIFEEIKEDGDVEEKEIEEIFIDLMANVEDISEYRNLLDDIDFELYDEIPNIREI